MSAAASVRPRALRWRVLLTIWNLLVPGLALIRTSGTRAAAVWLVAPFGVGAGLLLLCAIAPVPSFRGCVAAMILLVAAQCLVIGLPAVRTWRASARRPAVMPANRRWYVLLALWIALAGLSQAMLGALHRFYKPFFLPAVSMAPTLLQNDRILADMQGGGGRLTRGSILLVRCAGSVRVARLVAGPGERVTFRDDPIVNGVPATEQARGRIAIDWNNHKQPVAVWAEHLPDEHGEHLIAIAG